MITAEQARELTTQRTLKHYLDKIDREIRARAEGWYCSHAIHIPELMQEKVIKSIPKDFKVSISENDPSKIIINW